MRKLRIEDLDLFKASGTPLSGKIDSVRQRYVDLVDGPRKGRDRPRNPTRNVQNNNLVSTDRRPEEGQQQQSVDRSNESGLG